MLSSVECSNLLFCSEEVLCDDSYGDEEEEEEVCFSLLKSPRRDDECSYQCQPPSNWLDLNDCISELADREGNHMPKKGYSHCVHEFARARQSAIAWMIKVQAHYNFVPRTAGLAINYLDRFLSRRRMPCSDNAWMFQLVSVACLSLAAKMEETEVPLLLDLQVEGANFIFEPRTIQRMEIVILNVLDWKLNSVTPFSFIDLFLQKISIQISVDALAMAYCDHLILKALQDVRMVEEAPSAVAAAAMCRAMEKYGNNTGYGAMLSSLTPTAKTSAENCAKLMACDDINGGRGVKRTLPTIWTMPASPGGVLDAKFFGCDSESKTNNRSLESSQTNADSVGSSMMAAKRPRTAIIAEQQQ